MIRVVPTYRQRRRMMMCSASYWTWAMPWLVAPLTTYV